MTRKKSYNESSARLKAKINANVEALDNLSSFIRPFYICLKWVLRLISILAFLAASIFLFIIWILDKAFFRTFVEEIVKRFTSIHEYIGEVHDKCYDKNYEAGALVAHDVLQELQGGNGIGAKALINIFKKRKYSKT